MNIEIVFDWAVFWSVLAALGIHWLFSSIARGVTSNRSVGNLAVVMDRVTNTLESALEQLNRDVGEILVQTGEIRRRVTKLATDTDHNDY